MVIPAKAPDTAKGRLAGALSADDRNRLAARMLRTAIDAACEAAGADRVAIVGAAPADIDKDILVIAEPSGGLNAALDHARRVLADAVEAAIEAQGVMEGVTMDKRRSGSRRSGRLRHSSWTNCVDQPMECPSQRSNALAPNR